MPIENILILKQQRAEYVNQTIRTIANHGRRFFYSQASNRCASMEFDQRGGISRFGIYAPPTAGQRASVIADRIESHNSSPIWKRETQAEMSI